MINWLSSRMHRPEKGWDPVPANHVAEYGLAEWRAGARTAVLDLLESWVGGFAGKSVLDLGGGPGQYSVAFALRGARVCWYDVSARYRDFASEKAQQAGVQMRFSVGYMDEAPQLLREQFDLVFNRICWCYGRGDSSFARAFWQLVKPGGVGYIDSASVKEDLDQASWSVRTRHWMNEAMWFKVGHPFPPHGRLARIFSAKPVAQLLIDHGVETNDRILFRKQASS